MKWELTEHFWTHTGEKPFQLNYTTFVWKPEFAIKSGKKASSLQNFGTITGKKP